MIYNDAKVLKIARFSRMNLMISMTLAAYTGIFTKR